MWPGRVLSQRTVLQHGRQFSLHLWCRIHAVFWRNLLLWYECGVVQSRSVVFRLVVQIRTRNLAVTGSTLTRSTASNLKHVARQGNARQRCVMGMCLYAHLVQTKNKQCRSTIILQCYHPYLSDFCSRPRLTPQPHNLLCGQENSASYPPWDAKWVKVYRLWAIC